MSLYPLQEEENETSFHANAVGTAKYNRPATGGERTLQPLPALSSADNREFDTVETQVTRGRAEGSQDLKNGPKLQRMQSLQEKLPQLMMLSEEEATELALIRGETGNSFSN